jgi:hypothetical protein
VNVVNVHRNLSWAGGDGFSILDENLIPQGRALNVVLKNCTFVVLDEDKKRTLATGNRNVHAFVRGELIYQSDKPTDIPTRCVRVKYSPAGDAFFYTTDDLSPIWAAPIVWLTKGKAYVR